MEVSTSVDGPHKVSLITVSFVLNPFKTHYYVLILNDITMLATIKRKRQQAATLSTIFLIPNINIANISN